MPLQWSLQQERLGIGHQHWRNHGTVKMDKTHKGLAIGSALSHDTYIVTVQRASCGVAPCRTCFKFLWALKSRWYPNTQIHHVFFFFGGGAILRHTPNPLWLHICHRKMVKFFTLMTLQIWREAGRLCLELGRRVRWISGGRNFVWTFLCHFINLKETHREKTLEEMLGLTRNGKVFLSTNDFFGGAR